MGGAEQTNEQAMLTKRRVPDDEVEFISSNSFKKRRVAEPKHAQVAQGPTKSPLLQPPHPPPALAPSPALTAPPVLAPPPPSATSQPPPSTTPPPPTRSPPPPPQVALIANPTQTLTTDRRRSIFDANQAKAPTLGSTLETRGKSLPVLEKFAFPQPLAPVQPRSRRCSESISPKQLPQVYRAPPEASANINHSFLSTPSPCSENSVTLDQISCLDFNGTPTNTPGFDVSQVFSMDGGIMGSVGFGNAVNPTHGTAPLNPTTTPHNFIPAMTHSTGNVMAMPQGETGLALSIAALQNHNHTKERFLHRHPTAGNTVPRQPSPMSAPKAKPPCPQCVQSRLAQHPAVMNHMPAHHPANHQPNYRTPPMPVNNNNNNNNNNSSTPRPALAHSAPTSHPRPQLANNNINNNQRQHNNYHQNPHHNHQNHQPAPSSSMATHTITKPTSQTSSPFLQDIAQTIQTSFPYAQVAARHGMTPAAVAEVLASLVVVPLLLRVSGGGGGGGGRLPRG